MNTLFKLINKRNTHIITNMNFLKQYIIESNVFMFAGFANRNLIYSVLR